MAITEAAPVESSTRRVVDLLDPEWYRSNPHDDYSWMRANEPVYRDQRNGLWGITRHAELTDVERRSSVFVSGLGYRVLFSPDESDTISLDDPRHGQQRALVQSAFTRSASTARTEEIRELVGELLDGLAEAGGEVEVVEALAAQLPARLTCRLIGFPEERWRDLKRWSEQLMRLDMRDRDGKAFVDFVTANLEMAEATMNALGGGCPAHSLLSTWSSSSIDGEPMTPMNIIHEVGLFVAGGAETTRTLISHGLAELCEHPDDWEAMAADPSLVAGAVEELLRWVTPLNNFFRRAVTDAEVGGQAIGAGDRLVLLYPSANRDETMFDDPFRFDIRRSPNRHVAFGFGTHLCLGANLARTSVGVLLTEMTRRFTDLHPVGEPDVEANIFARAVRSYRLGYSVR